MNTPHNHSKRRLGRRLGEALSLLPVGLCALAAALGGQGEAARRWMRAEAGPDVVRPGTARVAVHAVLTVLLGVLSLVLAAVIFLAVARGMFYGLVDRGPYDHSWGGPGRAGAWLAHFAAATPFAVGSTGLLYGVARLHSRMTAPLRGVRRSVCAVPAVLVSCAAGALFVTGFVRQLP